MNKSNSIEAIDKTDLSEQTKFWVDERSKIENYFIEEINQRKSCSKKLSIFAPFKIVKCKTCIKIKICICKIIFVHLRALLKHQLE